ncbi:ATP synthase F1 subcomplex delta subunit [Paramicrobacterium humi]|uniref:ATP synthase subunit delta n=1 Tax=Paramicrobacterium humi TaxID=640635 RepID=A0A1H4PD19_9MICO|nr:F0F1 ATP synthase subunit delta [Microbacterium humi]SEC05290.1 ATP synthase F1 subcomplex delta subunit [Microbacterium humi]
MGSATREALAQSVAALEAAQGSVDLSTAAELLDAGRVIDASAQLRTLIADPAAEPEVKAEVANRVFGGRVGQTAASLLGVIARGRWSSAEDLLAGVEELGIRAAAISAPDADLESELFQFGRAVSSNAELELALSAKLGSGDAKADLVQKLLAGKASEQTVLIVSQLVRQARGRRTGELLRRAASVVASQRGRTVATVTSASPLNDTQVERLRGVLGGMYKQDIAFNLVVDPELVGGMRIQAGDDVIDGSIASRLADLKLKLAG